MQAKSSFKKFPSVAWARTPGHVVSGAGQMAADRIMARQVETVLATTNVAVASNVVILASLAFMLKDSANTLALSIWSLGILAILAVLFSVKTLYRAETPRDLAKSGAWMKAIEAVSSVRALGWGVGMIMFFPGADPGIQLVLGPTAAAIMFGGATVLSAIPSTAMAFISILGLSLLTSLLLDGSPAAIALAVMTVAFLAYLFASIFGQARFYISHAVAEIDNSEQKQTIGLLLNEFEEKSSDWLWHTDAHGRFTEPSPRFVAAAGRTEGELASLRFDELFAPPSDDFGTKAIDLMARREPLSGQEVVLFIEGERRVWSLTAGPRYDEDGRFVGYRGVASDVTDLRAATEQLTNLAHYDQLTGLLNRASFVGRLTTAMTRKGPSSVGIILFDLTGFKQVNDTLGHGVGDELLARIGERLRGLNSADANFARLGGDEFALLIDSRPNSAELESFSREALSLVAVPFSIGPHNVVIDASAGFALGGRDGTDCAALMRAADLALYAAKSSGRGRWREFDERLETAYLRRQNLERGLRDAIDRQELSLRFQPIVSAGNGQTHAIEALLRWQSAEFGAVSPDEFIPIAEECGLIVPIGQWVLEEACKACAACKAQVQVCVNVSPVQLRNRKFGSMVRQILNKTGLDPHRLVVEITEGVFLERNTQTDRVLSGLVAMGVQVALDDFGTGYSSLSYLRSFPFSKIKIDKSFVDNIAEGGPNAHIVKAIIDLAATMGYEVITEGVEKSEQLDEIVRLGGGYAQGFLFSKPLAETDLPRWFADPAHIGASAGSARVSDVA